MSRRTAAMIGIRHCFMNQRKFLLKAFISCPALKCPLMKTRYCQNISALQKQTLECFVFSTSENKAATRVFHSGAVQHYPPLFISCACFPSELFSEPSCGFIVWRCAAEWTPVSEGHCFGAVSDFASVDVLRPFCPGGGKVPFSSAAKPGLSAGFQADDCFTAEMGPNPVFLHAVKENTLTRRHLIFFYFWTIMISFCVSVSVFGFWSVSSFSFLGFGQKNNHPIVFLVDNLAIGMK